jgi:hypothetical protein
MKLKDLIQALSKPDHADLDSVMEMEVEFCTISSDSLSLLSVITMDSDQRDGVLIWVLHIR